MKIDISKLKEGERLALEHEYDPKELNLELYDLRYVSPLELKGGIERIKNSLFFKGSLRTDLEIACTRCLKTVKVKSEEPFDLYYPFTGQEELDTTDEIREVMLLSYPVKFICRESCKGLCPQCGTNLNEKSCRCVPEVKNETHAFDRLGEWYQKKKKKKS